MKIFYADAFPHHPTCTCNTCVSNTASSSADVPVAAQTSDLNDELNFDHEE